MADLDALEMKYDGGLTIATGRNRKDTHWKNREMSWSDLVRRLSETRRTNETYAEYLKLPKDEQTEVKDSAGGFVGGTLRGGRRKGDAVVWRHLITLDADFAYPGMWEDFTMLNGYACAIYSTHKHSEKKPRYRFVIPLKRPVTPGEYECVSRTVAGDIGIDYWDDTTYEPQRLMFWPTTSSDAEYIFKYQDAPWLDPDEVLSRYADWRDQSFWPESERARSTRQKQRDKAENPLEKTGFVGLFCRTYTISQAIEKFLPDVYEEAGDGRYTYSAGTSVGGLVVYDDDLFAYSHHGTDPMGGTMANAFDLVRIHKFGELDEGVENTPLTRMPSQLAMINLAREDEEVTQTAAVENLESAGVDFGEADRSWLRRLQRTQNGQFTRNAHNVMLIMKKDPNIAGKFALNEFTGMVEILGELPWHDDAEGASWSDLDDAGLRNYISTAYNISSKSIIMDVFTELANTQSFHPVREYLEGLVWDGQKRAEMLLVDYLGAVDSPYVHAVTRKTLTAAVARIMEPGVKFDNVLTLFGPQGHNKSEIVRRLGGPWASDSFITFSGKEAYEQLHGAWIIEMAELAAMRKAEIEGVKHFITKQVDRYRAAYARTISERPRQCIFVATTNDEHFLRDGTGNRRFWVVSVDKFRAKKNLWKDLTKKEVNQVWAEAVELWKAKEPLHLTGEIEEMATAIQAHHSEEDSRLGLVQEFLEKPVTENWYTLDLATRRMHLDGDFGTDENASVPRDRVCALEVWVDCFRGDPGRFNNATARDINNLLRLTPGWKSSGTKHRFGAAFGMQRSFIRAT